MNFKLNVGPKRLEIVPTMPSNLFKELKNKLTYRMNGYQYTNAYKSFGWDGYKCLLHKNQTAPAGLYRRIGNCIKRNGHKVELNFLLRAQVSDKPIAVHDLSLEDYQITSVEKVVKNKICTLSIPIRGGKTAIMGASIDKIDQYPVCVVTFGSDLVKQTREDLQGHLNKDIGYFSESKFEPNDIWVTSYQALRSIFPKSDSKRVSKKITDRNKEIKDKFKSTKVLFMDECQNAFSPNMLTALAALDKTTYRVSLSGTPRPDSVKELEMESVLGPIVHKVPFDLLIKKERIAVPIALMYTLPKQWYPTYLDEFRDIYKGGIVNNYNRNRFIAEIVKQLNARNKTCFVMIIRKEHGLNLRDLIPDSMLIFGERDTDSRFQLYKSLEDRKLKCIITTVGRMGLNLPKLDAIINAEGYKAATSTIQKMRSLTYCDSKKAGFVVDFMDHCEYLDRHSRKRLSIYKNIPGFIIKHKKVRNSYFEESNNG